MVPGWQVYVIDRGLRTSLAEVAHAPVIVWDSGGAGKPAWAHDAERTWVSCPARAKFYTFHRI
jgi:hypothetical protein